MGPSKSSTADLELELGEPGTVCAFSIPDPTSRIALVAEPTEGLIKNLPVDVAAFPILLTASKSVARSFLYTSLCAFETGGVSI